MAFEFELLGVRSEVVPIYRAGGFDLAIDGRPVRAELRSDPRGEGEAELAIDGRVHRVVIARHGDAVWVHLAGRSHAVELVDPLRRAREAARGPGMETLVAPMPGVVIEVSVAVGDAVREGDLLLTIESMKLQTPIRAPHAGRVRELAVEVGASFERGAVLARVSRAAAEEVRR